MFPTERFCWPLPLRANDPPPEPKPVEFAVPSRPTIELLDIPDELPVGADWQVVLTGFDKQQAASLSWELAAFFDHYKGSESMHELFRALRMAAGIQ